jgi:hypothetical protein
VGVRALRDFYAGSHNDITSNHVVEVLAQSPAQLGADRLQVSMLMNLTHCTAFSAETRTRC